MTDLQNIIIDEDNELLIETEMAEELAYDAAVFEEAMRDTVGYETYIACCDSNICTC